MHAGINNLILEMKGMEEEAAERLLAVLEMEVEGEGSGYFPERAKSLFILDTPAQQEAAKR